VAGLALLTASVACTSALKEPPPVAELGGAASMAPAGNAAVEEMLEQAAAELEKVPDADAVRRAQALYLDVARSEGAPVEAYFGAAKATAWLIEHEADGPTRKELSVEGVRIGQWCIRLFPEEVECIYRLALAVGQQARERPSTATDGLDVMVDLLGRVIDEDPDLDFAGGRRVLALVLLRAPGWPTGPGDPELGLEHARAAVDAYPAYPPNQLVLGEALLENGQTDAARSTLQRGVELARDETSPEAADWVAQGEAVLAEIR
jgi:hypothetical protein